MFRGRRSPKPRLPFDGLDDEDDEDDWGDPMFDMDQDGTAGTDGQEALVPLLLFLLDARCQVVADSDTAGRALLAECCARLQARGTLTSTEFLFGLTKARREWREIWNSAVPPALRVAAPAVPREVANKTLLSVAAQSRVHRSKSLSSLHGQPEDAALRSSTSLSIEEDLCAQGALSRYQADFLEEEKLGQGGFGAVFKVTNTLDKRAYAVKKIRFRRVRRISKLPTKVLREVRCLARLDHPNVVRYYGAWMEYSEVACDRPPSRGASDTHSEEKSDTLSAVPLSDESLTPNGPAPAGFSMYSEFEARLYIQMQLCSCSLKHYLDRPGREVNRAENLHIFREILQGLEYIHAQGLIHRDLKPSNIFVTSDAAAPTSTSPRADGMPHLHRARFLIGDFGVATFIADESAPRPLSASSPGLVSTYSAKQPSPLLLAASPTQPTEEEEEERPHEMFRSFQRNLADPSAPIAIGGQGPSPLMIVPPSPSVSFMNEHARAIAATSLSRTTGIGTVGYASPEQLRKDIYDEKTDIYSLGIILLELYHPFFTRMERAKVIDALRNRRTLPSAFTRQYPEASRIILWLTEENPENRPTAAELLRCPFVESGDPLTLLTRQLEEQGHVIDQLREQLAALREQGN